MFNNTFTPLCCAMLLCFTTLLALVVAAARSADGLKPAYVNPPESLLAASRVRSLTSELLEDGSDWFARSGQSVISEPQLEMALLNASDLQALYPTARTVRRFCGDQWQARYSTLHNQILSGNRPAKFLVYRCSHAGSRNDKQSSAERGCGGLGNRLRGLTSAFMLAVLTDRAFIIEWHFPDSLERYLIPNQVDWRPEGMERIRNKLAKSFYTLTEHGLYWGVEQWMSGQHDTDFFRTKDVTALFRDADIVYLTTIYDIVPHIRRNPLLQPLLGPRLLDDFHLGLGCSFPYLFHPSSRVSQLLQSMRKQMYHQWPVIALHIRVGDDSFRAKKLHEERYNFEQWRPIFDCAALVEKRCVRPALASLNRLKHSTDRTTKWLLSTDNSWLKDDAIREYGSKIVTQDARYNQHIGFEQQIADDDEALVDLEHMLNHDILFYRRSALRGDYHGRQLGAFVDHLLLQSATIILATGSSFSSTAHQANLGRSVYIEDCGAVHMEVLKDSLPCLFNSSVVQQELVRD